MLKIAILGPESTGKSTLAERLANHYHCDFVPDYSRIYLNEKNRRYTIEDVVKIAEGQQQLIEKAESLGNEILLSDTEMIVNKIWTQYVFGTVPDAIREAVIMQDFDLYLLCDIDLEWHYDPLRENPDIKERKDIFAMYVNELNAMWANYEIISGDGDERFHNALKAISKLSK